MYLAFRLMIREEESCLERRFGQRYLDYRRRVGGVLPKFYIKGKDK
jgi:protein-S-isoprenylcysteine O-methyltransferase Ste14